MSLTYNLLVLLAPQAAAEGKEKFKDNVDALIAKQKGKILSVDEWGERPLAYLVAKHDRGIYCAYTVEMEADKAVAFNNKLKLEKGVLRYLLVRKHADKKEVASKT